MAELVRFCQPSSKADQGLSLEAAAVVGLAPRPRRVAVIEKRRSSEKEVEPDGSDGTP